MGGLIAVGQPRSCRGCSLAQMSRDRSPSRAMGSQNWPIERLLFLDGIAIELVRKNVKHLTLRVYPPLGRVRLSAPHHLDLEQIQAVAIGKLDWIRKQQQTIQQLPARDRPPLNFVTGERHDFRGLAHDLAVIETTRSRRVERVDRCLRLYARAGDGGDRRQQILETWYRQQLRQLLPPLIAQYEPLMGVQVKEFGIKAMKTKWGTCNPRAQRIWLNLALIKKPPTCLEYVVVHEMAHLLEANHGPGFVAVMDRFMPQWRDHRRELNRHPI